MTRRIFKRLAVSLIASLTLAAGVSAQTTLPSDMIPPSDAPPVDPTAPRRTFGSMDSAIEGLNRAARAGRDKDPLNYLAHDMSDIVDRMNDLQTDRPVQRDQARVVDELGILIKKLEAQSKSGSGGGSNNPSKPMARSTLAGGPGGMNDLHDPKASERQWGALPPKEREQIQQANTEGFPPGYETLLQSYYRRLAEEKVEAPTDAAVPAPPATRPAS